MYRSDRILITIAGEMCTVPTGFFTASVCFTYAFHCGYSFLINYSLTYRHTHIHISQ